MPAAGGGLVTARHRGARAGVFGEVARAEKLSKSGHRFRQQAVCISVGSTRLLAQPPIGSPMHAPRLLRKRFQRVVAPAELILIFCARRLPVLRKSPAGSRTPTPSSAGRRTGGLPGKALQRAGHKVSRHGAGPAHPGDGGGDRPDAEQIGHQFGQTILGQQLIVQQVDHHRRDPRAVLHRRLDLIGKRGGWRPAAGTQAIMGAMLGDDERGWLRQVEYLAGAVAGAHGGRHRRPAGRAGRRVMIDDPVRLGNLPQGLAFMTFLPARRLVRRFAQARHPRRLLDPSLDGGLPLLELFNPSRRSSSAIRALRTAISAACALISAISSSRVGSLGDSGLLTP